MEEGCWRDIEGGKERKADEEEREREREGR